MKKVLTAVSLVVAVLLLAACRAGGGPGAAGLSLGSAPWKDGEKALYDVVDPQGNKLGHAERGFARDGDAWLLSAVDRIEGPDPAKPALDQAATVRVDTATLKPLGKEKTIHSAGTDATLSITYAGGKVEIKAVVNGESRGASIDLPANAIENDQLLMTLRALPFAEGYEASLVTVVPDSASKVNTVVRVKGKETVDTPAGTFETWRVELDFGQAKQTAWYQVAAPHHMVQYDNGAIKYVLSKS